ncbi:MAG: heat-shock protein, partial [Rhodocyclaceae bacterium]|nr:heat-shock protein [Rhodocyclaceae bacterium]
FDAGRQQAALSESIGRIAGAARQAIEQAGLSPSQIDALYFTGGSTALASLATAIAAVVPDAAQVEGDRFTSVVSGLALDASRRFG